MPSELSVSQVAGMIVAVASLGLLLANGIIMLLSPTLWLRLPPYLGFHGSYRRRRLSPAKMQIEIRLLGFVLAMFMSWMLASIFQPGRKSTYSRGNPAANDGFINSALCLVGCLVVASYGLEMLLRPASWIEKYIQESDHPFQGSMIPVAWALRLMSLLLIVPAVYFGWQCLAAILR